MSDSGKEQSETAVDCQEIYRYEDQNMKFYTLKWQKIIYNANSSVRKMADAQSLIPWSWDKHYWFH